jgi:hypothetical protein
MVFRLGIEPGRRFTRFALAKCQQGWSDYFLINDEIFGAQEPETFIPQVSSRRLFGFEMLPNLTEQSLTNLAISSGLIGHVLGIDPGAMLDIAAPVS